ncbi:hypothetical protein E3N88_18129 [Mikania micrantha]|uniref:Bidirectional sugar transporter SWEET n=1 Tax=Mikania micrantha TaxID=192012 RepID=A0A5N6NVL1_9ASTR|nr:hypothetical protein E3N88_18129 [Mikania micrantha]
MAVFVSPHTFEACKQAAGIAGSNLLIPHFYLLRVYLEHICFWALCVTHTNLSKNHKKPINRAVLRNPIRLCPFELLNLRMFKMSGFLLAVFGLFAVIVIGSLLVTDLELRHLIIGFLSCATLISMFASPLSVMNVVIQTRSVEFMPFYLSLSTFLMSTSFLLYGIFNFDPFIYVPNGIGTILGIAQLMLYFYYKNQSKQETREPLIESVA